jgi:hypothetical protein
VSRWLRRPRPRAGQVRVTASLFRDARRRRAFRPRPGTMWRRWTTPNCSATAGTFAARLGIDAGKFATRRRIGRHGLGTGRAAAAAGTARPLAIPTRWIPPTCSGRSCLQHRRRRTQGRRAEGALAAVNPDVRIETLRHGLDRRARAARRARRRRTRLCDNPRPHAVNGHASRAKPFVSGARFALTPGRAERRPGAGYHCLLAKAKPSRRRAIMGVLARSPATPGRHRPPRALSSQARRGRRRLLIPDA